MFKEIEVIDESFASYVIDHLKAIQANRKKHGYIIPEFHLWTEENGLMKDYPSLAPKTAIVMFHEYDESLFRQGRLDGPGYSSPKGPKTITEDDSLVCLMTECYNIKCHTGAMWHKFLLVQHVDKFIDWRYHEIKAAQKITIKNFLKEVFNIV